MVPRHLKFLPVVLAEKDLVGPSHVALAEKRLGGSKASNGGPKSFQFKNEQNVGTA